MDDPDFQGQVSTNNDFPDLGMSQCTVESLDEGPVGRNGKGFVNIGPLLFSDGCGSTGC